MMKTNDIRLSAIMAYLQNTYALRVTESEGERVLAVALAYGQGEIEIRGRDIAYGLPQVILVSRSEVLTVLP